MRLKVVIRLAVVVVALCASGCGDSQDNETSSVPSRGSSPATRDTQLPPMDAFDPQEEARNALIAEYQQLQQRLGRVQQEALADSVLQEAYAILEMRIEKEMSALDPEYPQKRDRMTTLQEEMAAAQEAGDQQAMMSIGEEGNALQADLEMLQTRVVDTDQIAADIVAFRTSVEVKMQEIDPESAKLMARVAEIAASLQASADAPADGTPGG
jgi:chromosome segregation ATPase